MFGKSKDPDQLKNEFLSAVRAAKRTPGHENKTKANKAYENLTNKQKLELHKAGVDFPGKTKRMWS